MRKYIPILLFSTSALAFSRTTLLKNDRNDSSNKQNETRKKAKTVEKNINYQESNLPSYFQSRGYFSSEENHIFTPTNRQALIQSEIKLGEVLSGTIEESILAFNESKTQVRAIVTTKSRKTIILLGEANLEPNSKRISISFNKLRFENENSIWSLKGNVIDAAGIPGLEGNVYSNEDKYFLAQLLTSASAGVVDASITRNENLLGNQTEEKSLDTLGKKALVSALGKTTELFAEKLKRTPEYSIANGPIAIRVLITDVVKATD